VFTVVLTIVSVFTGPVAKHLPKIIAGTEGLDNLIVNAHGMDEAGHHHVKPVRWLVALCVCVCVCVCVCLQVFIHVKPVCW
jgi:hypothetical protein